MSRTFPCRMYRTGLTPSTPFLPNAVKHSPGRGWGTNWTGNRTVTHCSVLVLSLFPLLERGNAVRFFHFVFSCLARRLLSLFSVLLFSGSLFEKIFGSELLFLGIGVGRVYFGAVLPMFLLYYLVFRSRKCLEKILFLVRSVV